MKKLLALSGGVGGAKLVYGLSQCLSPDELCVLANTGDDFEHLGLFICPDLDSIMYALAQLNNTELGWGIKNESWQFMQALKRLGGEAWFNLGDQDLATHIVRTQQLKQGKSLTQISQDLYQRLAIAHRVLPMCDEKVSTIVHCEQGDLSFQQYFVGQQCRPKVSGFSFQGIEQASLGEAQQQAIKAMDAVLICPSNPFVSVQPILSVPGLKAAIEQQAKPVVVVSPIIAGQAVKGPAAAMMDALNMPVSALGIGQYYQGFASHFVLDEHDKALKPALEALGYQVLVCQTLMHDNADKTQLAQTILRWLYG